MNVATKPAALDKTQNGSRINWAQQSPELVRKCTEVVLVLRTSSIEESIVDLVNIRASHLNGCSFCLDMHVKQAKMHGEREVRLYHLAAWRDSTLFTPPRARGTCMDGSPDQTAGTGRSGRTL